MLIGGCLSFMVPTYYAELLRKCRTVGPALYMMMLGDCNQPDEVASGNRIHREKKPAEERNKVFTFFLFSPTK